MKIDLKELLQSIGNEAKVETQISAQEISSIDEGLQVVQPVQISLHLINTGDIVLAQGSANTQVKLDCSRCLKSFDWPISVKIKEEYAVNPVILQNIKQKDLELHEDDFIAPLSADKTIDLAEMIRQNLLLVLPLKPLCDKTCQGLKG